MNHFSPTELVDFVEGTLDTPRAAHASTCDGCREQADAVRAALRETAAVTVPEPSPLFWDHLSARVRDAIAEAPSPRLVWWRRPAIAFACAAVAVMVVLVSMRALPMRTRNAPESAPANVSTGSDAIDLADSSATGANDAVWTVLRAAASDMQLEEARDAGLSVRPSSIDKAMLELTPLERSEFERLLRDELKRAGA